MQPGDDAAVEAAEVESIEWRFGKTAHGCRAGMLRIRGSMWDLLEDPDSSFVAQLISWWILLLIAVSVTTFILETVPGIHRKHDAIFEAIEMVCIINFVVEFCLRLSTCPSQKAFWADALNVVDFFAILPFFLELALQANAQGTAVLRAVRLVRIFRVVKVSRYLAWLRVFAATVAASVAPLGMILFIIILTVILLASFAFYTERGASPGFDSIPETFWWCIVTMTTIGFGNVVPTTTIGKVIGAIAGLSGVVILAIPISVIATNFQIEHAKLTTSRAAAARTKESDKDDRDRNTAPTLFSRHLQLRTEAISRATSNVRQRMARAQAAYCACCHNCARHTQVSVRPEPIQSAGYSTAFPIAESISAKHNSSRISAPTAVLRRHWSAVYLQTGHETIRSSRRRLMSALKQAELRNRDGVTIEAEELVGSIEQQQRAVFLAEQAEKELF